MNLIVGTFLAILRVSGSVSGDTVSLECLQLTWTSACPITIDCCLPTNGERWRIFGKAASTKTW